MALGAASIIQAGSGFLYIVLGLAVLVPGRRRFPLVALGIGLASFGATFVVSNLFMQDPANLDVAVLANTFGYLLAACGLAVFALGHPTPLPPSARRRLLPVAAVAVALSVWGALRLPVEFGHLYYGGATPGLVRSNQAAFTALYCVLALVVAVGAIRARSSSRRGVIAFALVAIGLGTYVAFNAAATVAPGNAWEAATVVIAWGTPLVAILLSGAAWAFQMRAGATRAGRNVLLALPAAALVGAADQFLNFPGEIGIIRILGATLIALAVLKYDLLGVELPPLALARGPLAAGALATLFIVAQVAQNFFSAEYGLLTGGVVAGAFLFAASPLQRAMERLTSARASSPSSSAPAPALAPAQSPSDVARREDIYLNAVRLALRDRRLTRVEERHLARLAQELEIGAARAHDLLVQAETEAGVA